MSNDEKVDCACGRWRASAAWWERATARCCSHRPDMCTPGPTDTRNDGAQDMGPSTAPTPPRPTTRSGKRRTP